MLSGMTRAVLREVIGEAIKRLAKVIGEPTKLTGETGTEAGAPCAAGRGDAREGLRAGLEGGPAHEGADDSLRGRQPAELPLLQARHLQQPRLPHGAGLRCAPGLLELGFYGFWAPISVACTTTGLPHGSGLRCGPGLRGCGTQGFRVRT